jgi:type 1 glutamine amidotransferase
MWQLNLVSWYHNYDARRSFYTALGHLPTNFSQPAFLRQLYGGILYPATGKNKKSILLIPKMLVQNKGWEKSN